MIDNLLGLLFVLVFWGLMVVFTFFREDPERLRWRPIPGFQRIKRAIGLAVEDGTQLHISLGRGRITDTQAASAFVGLSMMEQLIRSISESDHPPVVSTGNAALAILAQDTIAGTYRDMGISLPNSQLSAEITGLTPYSYAAGTLPLIRDDQVTANVFTGWYGSEAAWLSSSAGRQNCLSIAGTGHLPGQAVFYASAGEPLIGEELFAGGAYLNAGPMHDASLKTQDILRWIITAVILIGIFLKTVGADRILESLQAGAR
jgi:hypothetical protein